MNSPRTDPLQGLQPRTTHVVLPLNADCAHFDNRLYRVRSLGSLQNGLKPTILEPRCRAVHAAFFVYQLKKLTGQARHQRLIDFVIGPSAMPSSCKDIRAALAACLQESDCVMVYRHKPSDCLRPPLFDELPTKCQQLKKGYGQCKRGMVDMRKRFRGNQPIAVSTELEGGAGSGAGQLYAGKPAFGTVVKETSGNEPVEKDWREVENEKYRKEGSSGA